MSLFTEIDQLAVAVRDLDQAVAWHVEVFGMEVVHRERVEADGVEEALLRVAESYLQLLTPTRPDSTVARFLDRRGEGLHHVAYRVADIDATLAALNDEGVELIDKHARVGIRRSRVAFLHPRATGGVLTELVEPAPDH